MNKERLTLLQEEGHKVEEWLKENGYADGCVGAAFEPSPINNNQGRAIDFEYNGNIEDLDVEELATDIAENVIDDRFSVRVFLYDEEERRNVFCVEIWLNEEDTEDTTEYREELMKACAASALDFIDTLLFCMEEDGIEDSDIALYKEYLLNIHKMHYDTDIGEQGENITNYINSVKD